MHDAALVITSIAPPHAVLQHYATQCAARDIEFILIGDAASPADFSLAGCRFYSLDEQLALPFKLARLLPLRHYARKNLGYLLARERRLLLETDDDNWPLAHYWRTRPAESAGHYLERTGWTNVFRYFSDFAIWPRGFPLAQLHNKPAEIRHTEIVTRFCPIQHGLTNDQPDVDAIFRLVHKIDDLQFHEHGPVMLGTGAWCPFNSQNTAWFRAAFPLLYLPATCTFRMTDIWRSFVAQRVAWTCDWPVLFHAADTRQERNPHDLMRDFADEIPGYLHNAQICRMLEDLPLRAGPSHLADNMSACYDALVQKNYLDAAEMPLVEAWLTDIS